MVSNSFPRYFYQNFPTDYLCLSSLARLGHTVSDCWHFSTPHINLWSSPSTLASSSSISSLTATEAWVACSISACSLKQIIDNAYTIYPIQSNWRTTTHRTFWITHTKYGLHPFLMVAFHHNYNIVFLLPTPNPHSLCSSLKSKYSFSHMKCTLTFHIG